jgi:hypothetical protein
MSPPLQVLVKVQRRVTATTEQCKALFACAESVVNQRLASVSNRYLIPESLQWASAGWTI